MIRLLTNIQSMIVQHKPSSSGEKNAQTDQGIFYGHTENNGFIL